MDSFGALTNRAAALLPVNPERVFGAQRGDELGSWDTSQAVPLSRVEQPGPQISVERRWIDVFGSWVDRERRKEARVPVTNFPPQSVVVIHVIVIPVFLAAEKHVPSHLRCKNCWWSVQGVRCLGGKRRKASEQGET